MDLMSILAVVIPIIIGVIFGFIKRQNWLDAKVTESLEAGVMTAWKEFGKDRKAELVHNAEESSDPNVSVKFTKEDQEKLRTIAKDTAKVVLKEQGLDLDKLLSSSILQDLKIKQLVDKAKLSQ